MFSEGTMVVRRLCVRPQHLNGKRNDEFVYHHRRSTTRTGLATEGTPLSLTRKRL
jgi:hypothetical protein